MPQIRMRLEGLIIAENGGGTFVLGQGDLLSRHQGTKLQLAVSARSRRCSPPTSTPASWRTHLALVVARRRRQAEMATLFCDGSALRPAERWSLLCCCPARRQAAHWQTQRSGSCTCSAATTRSATALVDDVAVFTAALSASQIQKALKNAKHLDGGEKPTSLPATTSRAARTPPSWRARSCCTARRPCATRAPARTR